MIITHAKAKIEKSKVKGFSLIELVIVLLIILTILATIGFRTSGAISNLSVEAVASEIALAIYQAKEQAITGNSDILKRTFDLEKALVRPHNGINVTTNPTVRNRCKTPCDLDSKTGEINSICVSDNNFCFTPSSTFTFDRFSGRLASSHVIFINSDKRSLAILLTKAGEYYIAELVNDTWQTQRDLQKLFPKESTTSKSSNSDFKNK